ncbi:CalY family protein [Cellulosimicrobium sp. Marseille-Q4280]|uniref:CalY family protein n=1 Tax=Cellulosimicrobium sp. Marseille-Q4280 TaxID=2937992 RepID=UPI0020403643|nr:CalY family protein [Cellulosimicrobium sp. Marseille-Q4280]
MSEAASARRRVLALAAVTAGLIALGTPGTTARFHEVEQVQAGTFSSGRLDLTASPAHTAFRVHDMAPGDTVAYPVELTNAGTADLTWTPSVHVADDGALAAVLSTQTIPVTDRAACTPQTAPDASLLATPGWADPAATFTGQGAPTALAPGQLATVCLLVTLDRDAPAEYAGASATLQWVFDATQTAPAAPLQTPEESGPLEVWASSL